MKIKATHKKELIAPLFQVFRNKGYAGVSLNNLAEATGLKKATLYHHFPKGKEQIARSVINHLNTLTKKEVFDLLTQQDIPPQKRLNQLLKNLTAFYKNGEENCLLGSIALDANHFKFKEGLKANSQLWLDAFYNLAKDVGYSDDKARLISEHTLVLIQGALIVSRASDATQPFQNALKTIKNLYKHE